MKKLQNKRTLITGAGRGIGAEIAKNIAEKGGELSMSCISDDRHLLPGFNR